ncbi:formate dehydrogenase, partial [Chloroflexota bacterium]
DKLVDALLVQTELSPGKDVAPTLVTEPAVLAHACPLAPVMPVSMALVVSRLTRVAPSKRKIGVVLRPCELRALIELVKLKQASLENLLLIGLDCSGTRSLADYRAFHQGAAGSVDAFLAKDGGDIREACQVCEYFTPWNADLVIGLFGVDTTRQVLLQAMTLQGEEVLAALKLPEAVAEGRETAIAEIKAKRLQKKKEMFERVQGETAGDNLPGIFASCTNCHNCRVACPVCYCRECFLESPTFEWEAEKYLALAEKKGALRLPADTLLFHLTRLTHVGISCVGCGLCQDACPEGIPLFPLFRFTGDKAQELFDYVPGRSLEEEPPLTMFQEDELGWVEK